MSSLFESIFADRNKGVTALFDSQDWKVSGFLMKRLKDIQTAYSS